MRTCTVSRKSIQYLGQMDNQIIFHQYLKKLFLKKVKSDMVRKYTKKYYFSVEGEKMLITNKIE